MKINNFKTHYSNSIFEIGVSVTKADLIDDKTYMIMFNFMFWSLWFNVKF